MARPQRARDIEVVFVGQIMASVGFVIYSWMLRNWVFVVTNVLMLATALLGQWSYLRNKTPSEPHH